MKKRIASIILSSALILGSVITGSAINVVIDNKPLVTDVAPFASNGRTLVPLAAIFSELGATVSWNDAEKKITAVKEGTTIELVLNNKNAYIDGKLTVLDVAPITSSGRTMVPLAFVSTALGADVAWDGSTQTAKISTSGKVDSSPFAGYKLIEVDGGNLSGHRESKVVVDIGFGDREYWAFTNEYGQLVRVIADKIVLQDAKTEPVLSTGRYYRDEAKVPGTERSDLDEGHVIADSLGGVSNAYNITPQDSTLNRHGDQAYMEKVIRDAGGCTNFEAIITYPNTTTQIPSKYKYTYNIKGNVIVDEFENTNPDKVNEPLNNDTDTDNGAGKTDNFILNTNTKKVHTTTCRYVASISAANKSTATTFPAGYEACGVCNP